MSIFTDAFEDALNTDAGEWFVYRFKSPRPARRIRGKLLTRVDEIGDFAAAQTETTMIRFARGAIDHPQAGDTIRREATGQTYRFSSLDAVSENRSSMTIIVDADE